MIHLTGNYCMSADGNAYIVAKAVPRDAGKVSLNRSRYYTTLASAVAGTAEIALRDKIAAGEITTLHDAVEELRKIKDEILASIGDGEEVQ